MYYKLAKSKRVYNAWILRGSTTVDKLPPSTIGQPRTAITVRKDDSHRLQIAYGWVDEDGNAYLAEGEYKLIKKEARTF